MPITRQAQAEPPRKILPLPAPDSEDHTLDPSELADLAAYVVARSSLSEPTLSFVPPDAVTRQVIDVGFEETRLGPIDTDNEKSSSWAIENKGLAAPFYANSADLVPIAIRDTSVAPVAFPTLSVSNRKPPVRLTDKERETAIRLGLQRASMTGPQYLGRSVLDAYEPLRHSREPSSEPSKNMLVQRIARQAENCAYCDRRFGSLALIDDKLVTLTAEADHFEPRAKRLNNSASNIVAACQVCNRLKGSRVFGSIPQARAVLQAAWAERGWRDAPLLIRFKWTMPTCFN